MFASLRAHLTPSPISPQGLYRREQIEAIEAAAKKTLPAGALMRAAGIAAANLTVSLLPQKYGKILVLAGAGNNGGDALETAHLLAEEGYEVDALLIGEEKSYSIEARQSLQRAQHSNVRWITQRDLENTPLEHWQLLIDGIFGIGLNRPIEGKIAQLIEYINSTHSHHSIPIIALDIPSGLNVDTGTVLGEKSIALRASHTISFIANKIGLHTAKGKDYAGQIYVDNLAIDPSFYPPAYAHLLTNKTFVNSMPRRLHDSHKGSYGDVLIVGGNTGMSGAPLLSGRAALHCGAGRVHLGFIDHHYPVDFLHPEIMIRAAEDSNYISAVVGIGPGLGVTKNAERQLQRTLQESAALVIDADALNLIASHKNLQKLLRSRKQQNLRTIMTPHPLEAARLLETTVHTVQADRCHAAKLLVEKFEACVILKGAGTVIADADYIWINSSGNPALATAGTGDVLTGVCTALLAQGLSPAHAACLATYVHGKAADDYLQKAVGPIGMTAAELIPLIRTAINTLVKV